ncbi:unnamed protein product [Sphagnum balticum]
MLFAMADEIGSSHEQRELASPAPASSQRDPGDKDRGWLRVHNVGGSLTFLLQIALVAWGVRQLRRVLARQQHNEKKSEGPKQSSLPVKSMELPLFAHLSPLAVQKLIELDPTPYILIDVRFPDASQLDLIPFDNVIHIPESEVRASLQLSPVDWNKKFPSVQMPKQDDLLVFISTRGKRAGRAAAIASNLGYSGCCVLKGGIQALQSSTGASNPECLQYLNRDAVFVLLHDQEKMDNEGTVNPNTPRFIDLRRHDELALFGQIPGSLHLQVQEWPKALAMDSRAWEQSFKFPKLGNDDLVILHCRSNRRASWAAYLAQDAGLKRCFVYKQGVFGWRVDHAVLPYESYELEDVPPEPLKFDVEAINVEAGKHELQMLGLLKMQS